TTLEIREFIRNNINYLVSELHRQIREKKLKEYEISWFNKHIFD
ncbi:35542_t:CDS:1, partial [Gigaspora margarita]